MERESAGLGLRDARALGFETEIREKEGPESTVLWALGGLHTSSAVAAETCDNVEAESPSSPVSCSSPSGYRVWHRSRIAFTHFS